MEIIQTLYIKNDFDPYSYSFGWKSPAYHLMSWALSSLQLYKIYGTVSIYANQPSLKLLTEDLQLPYTNIFSINNKLPLLESEPKLWALPKIYTYSLQTNPFLHIDGDVFLFDRLDLALLSKQLIAQNPEQATEYYTSTQRQLMKHFDYFPDCVRKDFETNRPIKAVNAGILGGSDIDFFKNYTNEAFKYIDFNKHKLAFIDSDKFNVFFEQHLFFSLAKEKEVIIDFLFSDMINDNSYKFLSEFHETPKQKKYLHLLGHYKKDEYTCMQMAAKLRELYPYHYYKIIDICHSNRIDYPFDDFYFDQCNNYSDFANYNKSSLKHFLSGGKAFKKPLAKTPIFPAEQILENDIRALHENDFSINRKELRKHCYKFFTRIRQTLQNNFFDNQYLYGRDLSSQVWYSHLFDNDNEIGRQTIKKEEACFVIQSKYDWGKLLNKNLRFGVKYYENFLIQKGRFYNLIIPEVSDYGISVFDIDEIEFVILNALVKPMQIQLIINELENYVDKDVVEEHYELFKCTIVSLIKGLVVKKAIAPG